MIFYWAVIGVMAVFFALGVRAGGWAFIRSCFTPMTLHSHSGKSLGPWHELPNIFELLDAADDAGLRFIRED